MRNVTKAQASLEQLVIYGAAVVIVVVVGSILFLTIQPPAEVTACSNFQNLNVKAIKADNEKITLLVNNAAGTSLTGFEVLTVNEEKIYEEASSPPFFIIELGDATVGNTTNNSGVSFDWVSQSQVPNYSAGPLNSGVDREVVIPWPIHGFAGAEFGEDPQGDAPGGCNFFTESVGKKFTVTITAYYRNAFGYVTKDTAQCTGVIDPATEFYFPQSLWGC
ncbi:MAG: hypothetical protein JW772_00670 [Candidatus Diapherotrites archaeon]|nr:hypothetical protein [Candidatus Diapherotrites archaeon]